MADLERRWAGKHLPKPWTITYALSNTATLRRPLESAQYTSIAFGKRCEQLGVRPSMGSVGDAYDNAMAESFFATLECELLDRTRFHTPREAYLGVFEWIEGWYNPHRRHSSIGYLSPTEFERRHAEERERGGFAPGPPVMIEKGRGQEGLGLESGELSTEPR